MQFVPKWLWGLDFGAEDHETLTAGALETMRSVVSGIEFRGLGLRREGYGFGV